jgi:hypothetical protein
LARQNKNKSNTKVTSYYDCRLHPTKDHVPKGDGKTLRKRQKPSRTAIGCPIKIKVVSHEDFVEISQVGNNTEHNHDLDTLDREKRASIFRTTVAEEVSKGYKVSDVSRNARAVDRPQDRIALENAGGRWINLKDAHNASAVWKSNNPDGRTYGRREAWIKQRLSAREWMDKNKWLSIDIQVRDT